MKYDNLPLLYMQAAAGKSVFNIIFFRKIVSDILMVT
jgi:hypothetical protein